MGWALSCQSIRRWPSLPFYVAGRSIYFCIKEEMATSTLLFGRRGWSAISVCRRRWPPLFFDLYIYLGGMATSTFLFGRGLHLLNYLKRDGHLHSSTWKGMGTYLPNQERMTTCTLLSGRAPIHISKRGWPTLPYYLGRDEHLSIYLRGDRHLFIYLGGSSLWEGTCLHISEGMAISTLLLGKE